MPVPISWQGRPSAVHEIERLDGTHRLHGEPREPINRSGRQFAVGIHDDDDLRRIRGEVPDAEIQRITLAAQRRALAQDHESTLRARDPGRRIRTIVRDHEEPVAGFELRHDRPQRQRDDRRLVVRRHEHRNPGPGGRGGGWREDARAAVGERKTHLDEEHPNRHEERGDQAAQDPCEQQRHGFRSASA
jgi:hypothetical protein